MQVRALALAGLSCLVLAGCPATGETDDGVFTFTTTLSDEAEVGDSSTTTTTGETGEVTSTDEAPANCGDGVVQDGEECDLGSDNSESGQCTPECTIAACGDGYVFSGEDCDDGNQSNTDACVGTCDLAACGDGFVQEGVEECDDGNTDDTDGCTSSCTPGVCGDGIIQAGEQCDDGNMATDDSCPACQLAFCGDGHVQAGVEECDDGNMAGDDGCQPTFCTNSYCGDGAVWAGMEECDDGNASDEDACPSCQTAYCGDGFVQDGVEDCDDANMNDSDGCTNACTSECGGKFTQIWCLQVGTMEQYTRCESIQNGGNTCINPEIRYGNVEGGIPRQHPGNNFQTWCQQLGFSGFANNVAYGSRACNAPQGGLFGCNGYDEAVWHWCDWQDGPWYNQQLDWHQCNSGTEITSITCTP